MPTPTVYSMFKLRQHDGNPVDLDTDTIKVMLLDSNHSVNQAHDFIDDVSANEVNGDNYTAGGKAITSSAVALDGETLEWSHADVTWSQHATGFANARHAVWYKDTGTPSTSGIILSLDLGADKGNVSGDLTLDVDPTTGVLNL